MYMSTVKATHVEQHTLKIGSVLRILFGESREGAEGRDTGVLVFVYEYTYRTLRGANVHGVFGHRTGSDKQV